MTLFPVGITYSSTLRDTLTSGIGLNLKTKFSNITSVDDHFDDFLCRLKMTYGNT